MWEAVTYLSVTVMECDVCQRTACSNILIRFFAPQVKDNKPVRPKSAMLPEKDYSLSELLSQVDSGISRSFDRVKEDSCHSKENTCKRLSGISSADSAFSSQDSITLSFEKESTYGKSWLQTYNWKYYISKHKSAVQSW